MQGLRDTLRGLRSAPVVTVAAVFSLALGIGASTGIFSLLNAILFRPLPVREPERLVLLSSGDQTGQSFPQAVWRQVRDRGLFENGFAWSFTRFNTKSGGERAFVDGLMVSGRTFESLGLSPALGRLLVPSDERAENGFAAVISYRFWQDRFGRAPEVLGRTIALEGRSFTIVGVTPKAFTGLYVGLPFDIAVPLDGTSEAADAAAPYVLIMARMRPADSVESVTAALRTAQAQIRTATNPYTASPYKDEYLREPFVVRPAANGVSFLERRYARPFKTLLVSVAGVIVVACGNIAMLLTARALGRRKEFGMRAALGASRLRLARQLVVEGLVLSFGAACLGLLLAQLCATFVAGGLSTQAYSVSVDLTPDWRVLAFATAVSVIVALLFSVAPVLHVTRTDIVTAIQHQRSGIGGRMFSFGNATVVAQIAVSVVLLTTMGLLVRTFWNLSHSNVGFDRDRVLVVTVEPGPTDSAAPAPQLHRAVLEAVTRLADVESADYSVAMPGGNVALTPWIALANGRPLPQGPSGVYANRVGPGWFRTLGTRLVAGRGFETTDDASAPAVAVVNETFVRRFLDVSAAIGSRLEERQSPDGAPRQLQIIGVVEDSMYRFVRESPPPTIYTSLAQAVDGIPSRVTLSVRARGAFGGHLSREVAGAIGRVDSNLSMTFRSLMDQVNAQFAQERLMATGAAFFGVFALVLSAVGVYGVTAYTASRRRIEVGVRLALGSSAVGILRLLLGRLAVLVLSGVTLGLVATLWAGQFVNSLLFGVEARDATTLTTSCIVLAAVAGLAVWLPAYRATRCVPALLLREE